MKNIKCDCVNCDCKKCGKQNPERLIGKAATKAGLQSWDATWYCDEVCNCCDK